MNHDRESEDSDDVSNDYGSEEIGILTTSREKAYLRERKKNATIICLSWSCFKTQSQNSIKTFTDLFVPKMARARISLISKLNGMNKQAFHTDNYQKDYPFLVI